MKPTDGDMVKLALNSVDLVILRFINGCDDRRASADKEKPAKVASVMRKSNTGTAPRFLRLTRFQPKLIAGLWILVLVASMIGWLVALVWIAYLLIRRLL
jgi:hypothetical protein